MATAVLAVNRRPGGQPGNRAGVIHGCKCLTLGRTPKGSGWVKSLVSQFRRAVTLATLERAGDLGLYHHAVIQTCCRNEQGALLAQRFLRLSWDTLTPDQRLSWLTAIAKLSEARDRGLRGLGLDTRDPNVLTSLYAGPGVLDVSGETRPRRDGRNSGHARACSGVF